MSDGPPTLPVPSLPSHIGPDDRYRILGQLGAGGMGLVVRARDEVLGRDVAVKLLADNLAADEGARERFLREARAAAAIHDPRVVAVHDVGEDRGRPYLVMECVEGRSLAEALAADGPLDGDDAADAAVDALAGLSRAHEAGLLHRDVKPANLLQARDGTVKVTDFGVAVAADAPGLTRAGFVMGTAEYLAPERRRGEPATVATDLWALGATLLEVLTGHPPSPDADAALAERGDQVPPRLRTTLERLLDDDPDARPASALEALELLGGELRGPLPAAEDAAEPSTHGDEARPTTVLPESDPDATAAVAPAAAVVPPTGTTTALPVEQDAAPLADPAAGHQGDGATGDLRRWIGLALVAVLLLVGVVVVSMLTDGGPTDGTFEVEVDTEDPGGTARELGEQLRERAGR